MSERIPAYQLGKPLKSEAEVWRFYRRATGQIDWARPGALPPAQALHESLDALLAQFLMASHDKVPSRTTVIELLCWSAIQAGLEVTLPKGHPAVSEGPHDFWGRPDRPCEICQKPDRHPIHEPVSDRILADNDSTAEIVPESAAVTPPDLADDAPAMLDLLRRFEAAKPLWLPTRVDREHEDEARGLHQLRTAMLPILDRHKDLR